MTATPAAAGQMAGPSADAATTTGPSADAATTTGRVADERDLAAVAAQLGRTPRGTRAVAHRCPCQLPDVVETVPRLADGTPFPTLFYLTCPRATAACSRLESAGLMREYAEQLIEDPEFAAAYRAAHEDYLARREAIGHVPEIAGVSAGGMPGRVKCLHVHLGHALAVGPGVNPIGDRVREVIGSWWDGGPCVPPADLDQGATPQPDGDPTNRVPEPADRVDVPADRAETAADREAGRAAS